ncbi:MAG: hypothetical protein AB2604_14175 [Candidatus Thiodiazotropha taylori]
MAVTYSEMEKTISELGYKSVHSIDKVTEYLMPKQNERFYLHKETQKPKIVVRPVFEAFKHNLGELPGVIIKESFYHNADMTSFPKKIHTGKREVHYGIAFEFENTGSISKLLTEVAKIAAGS